ncbi:NYN domain-containing protein [Sphingomonas sanguinis]|uniref:NYN domain-containing protein n=1 Tax=Sphingomonas sanguinis TaxID=33051 RepID=UPI0009EF1B98|nr:NYN domain-containing protein [Sphingomonas sanguinis]
MDPNYFFIDGSALMAQIRQLQRAKPEFRNRKLCPKKFLNHQMKSLNDLHGGSYKRATFYFANGDDANIAEYLVSPEYAVPGIVRDLHFKFCGHKLKKSAEFGKFVEEIVPHKFQGRFSKSEKGIDIEMCCDALRLASASRIDRLFLLTNDGDFIPFCRTVKEFGANISIIHLSTSNPPNADLLREADSYDVVPDDLLDQMFTPPPVAPELPLEALNKPSEAASLDQGAQSEKPDAEPSDLSSVSDQMEE